MDAVFAGMGTTRKPIATPARLLLLACGVGAAGAAMAQQAAGPATPAAPVASAEAAAPAVCTIASRR